MKSMERQEGTQEDIEDIANPELPRNRLALCPLQADY